jgi:hypothetical protein
MIFLTVARPRALLKIGCEFQVCPPMVAVRQVILHLHVAPDGWELPTLLQLRGPRGSEGGLDLTVLASWQ